MTGKEDMGGKPKASDSGSHVPGPCPQAGRSAPLFPEQVPFTLLSGHPDGDHFYSQKCPYTN